MVQTPTFSLLFALQTNYTNSFGIPTLILILHMDGLMKESVVEAFLKKIVARVGPRKKEGENPSQDDWKSIFAFVKEEQSPCGWKTAVSEWARVLRKVLNDRWEKGDTSVRHIGRPHG